MSESLETMADPPPPNNRERIADHAPARSLVQHVATAALPTVYADEPLQVHAFRSLVDGAEHLAMVRGPIHGRTLVRIHSECLTGDALGSLRCDCGAQLQSGLRQVSQSGSGVLIYLRGQEGRGIGLANKIRAYALQDQGLDTVEANAALGFPADLRSYDMAAEILRALGVEAMTLLTNNPRKIDALEACGFVGVARASLQIAPTPYDAGYLDTKRDKLGHALPSHPGGPAADQADR